MPKLSDDQIPAYRLHKQSGQAIVTLSGCDHLLGPHGTPASRGAYNRLTAEWIAGGRRAPQSDRAITIVELIAAFWRHAQAYYRDADGQPTKEISSYAAAMKPLRKLYGRTIAAYFGPLALAAVREEMIRGGWCRKVVNSQVGRVRRMFKWASSQELVPAGVWHGLATVEGLKAGRTNARETEPVKPVAESHALAILPFVSRQVGAMVRLQLLCGARPGEIVILRSCDIDMTSDLWIYRPSKHKTAYRGHKREIYLGPKAQEILRPFLKLDPTAYLFSPADAEAERRVEQHKRRKTPLSCGNKPGSNVTRKPKRPAGERYDVIAYGRAITRACDRAFPLGEPLAKRAGETAIEHLARLKPAQRVALKKWRDDHRFHAHQMRHTAATELRKQFGVEAARVALGHRSLEMTELYAEQNLEDAKRIIGQVG